MSNNSTLPLTRLLPRSCPFPRKKIATAQMTILPLPSPLPLLFLLITLPFLVNSHISPPATQRDAVINLKQQLGNPSAYLTSLNSPCDLLEIHCSVTGIFLRDKGIGKEIPHTICGLKNLSRICFIATVPAAVGIDNLACETSLLNKQSLCPSNPMSTLQTCSFKSQTASKFPPILALVLVLVAALLTLFTVRDRLRKRRIRDVATWKLISFQRLDFTEANVLSGLIDGNTIGSGGSGNMKSPFPSFVHFPVSSISTRKQICVSRVNMKQKVKATVFSLMLFLAIVSGGDALKLLNEPGNKPEVPATNEFLPGENSPSASTPAIEEGNLIDAKGSISPSSPGN